MKETINELLKCFPQSVINHNGEFIVNTKANNGFNLLNCNSELEVKCKILEWLSRPAYKEEPFRSKKKNNEYHAYVLNGINKFLNTNFTEDDIETIYTYLGNFCNRNRTIKFIQSGYDLNLLEV